jgi:hypothetical protein
MYIMTRVNHGLGIGFTTGDPGVFFGNPHPYPWEPVPVPTGTGLGRARGYDGNPRVCSLICSIHPEIRPKSACETHLRSLNWSYHICANGSCTSIPWCPPIGRSRWPWQHQDSRIKNFSNQTLLIQNYADGFNNGNSNKHNNFDDASNNSLLAATVEQSTISHSWQATKTSSRTYTRSPLRHK